jgi:SAM-dependent methyltransferase
VADGATDSAFPFGERERYGHLVDNRAAWETHAHAWLAWARSPDHDAYWQYREAFFRELVPRPGRGTVEVGCGEGRVCRDLVARGHTVAAIDGSPTLVRHAAVADQSARYCVADAVRLPFPDGAFDLAIAYNTLMDFDDMPGAVREVARVLEPGAMFCICVTHPMFSAGRFESGAADSPLRLTESYLESRAFDAVEERDGLAMRFTGWSHPLETYVTTLTSAGFVVDTLREPVPASRTGSYERFHRYPLFLNLRAIRS